MNKVSCFLLVAAVTSTFVFLSCQKEVQSNSGSGTTTLKVRMTDAPVPADSVNIDIREIRANFSNDTVEWVSLNTVAGVYDLLGLQNGVDTLLAVGTVPTDTLKQIRFILGTNNSIVVNGVNYPLTIPSGAESGLKIMVNKRLNANLDSLIIDFDAALSVHQTGQGEYMLRPVLKIK
jgi:hypothetical protein